jgi:outer membrane receptor protein involved in Fe transport
MHVSARAVSGAIFSLFVSPFLSGTAAADDSSLDEVIVTADLRERELRNLPASATVLDSATLEAAGVQHFQDVLGLVPNLNWSAGTSRPRFFQLRGIGELEQWQGAPNPSVGFLIDGVDFSGVGMPATLADVERIEVLRGPQGTIYGANALAGLIAVNTRAPRRDAELNANATIGDYGTYGANAVLGGPLGSGEAAWRLVAGNYRSDGFRRDTYLGRDDTNGYDETSARLRLSARPLEHVGADFTAMWVDLDNGYDAFSVDNSRITRSDKPGQDAQIARALAVRLDFDGAESFDIVSRSSLGATRNVYSFDGDWGNDQDWGEFAPYDYFQRLDRERRTLSQDLRLVSRADVESGADFAWLAGIYALRTDEQVDEHNEWDDAFFGAGEEFFSSDYRATNLAAYGEVEWRVAGKTVLALGGRVENRSADYEDSGLQEFSPDETMFGGSVTLRHELNEGASLYARLARGYKAGGFNIGANLPPGRTTFDTETLNDIEAGWRATGLDGRLASDLAVFYMRREDQQVPITEQLVPGDPLSFVLYTANAARGENYGLEATLRWRAHETLLLDLRAALLETRYIGYRFGDRDLDGREQSHAPQYQFDLGFEYREPRGFFARLDFAGLDDFYFDASHDQRAPARVLTHLKTGFSGKHWRAELWVRNLFDRYYSQRGFHFGLVPPEYTPSRYVQAGDPRHVGVTVAYVFR